jgi:hypothetical protein
VNSPRQSINSNPREHTRVDLDPPLRLDGITFEVIVGRLDPSGPGGAWIVRVYWCDEHIYSAEGGVSLEVGLREAQEAMVRHCRERGA